MNFIEKTIKEFEKSEVFARIVATDNLAMIHGFGGYKGQTIQDFIRSALLAQKEEILKCLPERNSVSILVFLANLDKL